ncbi:hypothetical protein [Chryseobacterium sp. G0201]|uniref:hypothetical protein n=1 Tax=Chryseobacterium sp. G0201 TaxID=2487065 RepID=UPI000F4E6155|nr:hypothetical protein [Chryseobacterium sp. G0201]AZA54344.1 hypothetical protein EG348_15770 [Chryseobacterium sp. G0201]
MRLFLIGIFLLLVTSCKAQNNQNLESEIISFFKISDKDIQNCHKESEELRNKKTEEWIIDNIYDQCIAYYEHFNFYRDNTLKMLKKTSNDKDFLIINYISDNIYIPRRTKTILKTENNYYGLKHYTDDSNDNLIEKDEGFEVSKYDVENIQKIDEYLRAGKSEYISDKIKSDVGYIGSWYIVTKINGKIKMLELFRIK